MVFLTIGSIFAPPTEAFLLFSQSIPSQNELGIIDPKASSLELTVNGRDLTVTQSPSVLSSNRAGGTTGAGTYSFPRHPPPTRAASVIYRPHADAISSAVVWKVTPMFASWLASPTNILFRTGVLCASSTVLELGCGVSALVGLALGPMVARYVLSDQPYVARFVEQNLEQNQRHPPAKSAGKARGRGNKASGASGSSSSSGAGAGGSIAFHPLDWESDTPTAELTGRGAAARSFDLVLGCDCVYNEALVPPFAQTCLDACRLRSAEDGGADEQSQPPCVCLVAQQLRDPEIFEAWLREFCARGFRVWRIPDSELPEGLRGDMGFVIHVGVLR